VQFGKSIFGLVEFQNGGVNAAFLVGLDSHKTVFLADAQVYSLVEILVGSFGLSNQKVLFEFFF
jgi:hypothetical protein